MSNNELLNSFIRYITNKHTYIKTGFDLAILYILGTTIFSFIVCLIVSLIYDIIVKMNDDDEDGGKLIYSYA